MSHASLCLLSYNRPHFLREGIASLREHAGAPFELIVHDDGSDDGFVYETLREFHQDGIVSTVILNTPGHNQGQGVALNRMFGMASGDPIIKLDQDLLYNEGWLADTIALLELANQPPIKKMVLADIPPIVRPIGLLGLMHYHHDPVDSAKTLVADCGFYTERTHILGSAFALTRDAWETFGPFEEHSEAFAEDWSKQKQVAASTTHCCALPADDLVVNRGFGIGPSTVVVGEGQVHPIYKEPFIHGVQ